MQSAGGDDKKTERKEQKFEPVAAVPVIVDVSIRSESTRHKWFDSICPLSTDRSEMNETWLCMGSKANKEPYAVTCWDLENDTMHSLTNTDFMVTSLKLALFQGGAGCQSIEINGIKYGMLAVDNELIIFQATRDPSGQYSELSPHLQRDIFRKDEEKEYFKRMVNEESGRARFTIGGPSDAHYNRKVFPRKTEVFPDQQHVAIEYKGERIFIVGLSHDMSFSFAFPEGQRIDAFTVNKDGVLIAFPSVGKEKPLPGYYFQVIVDFENQTAQIEKIISTLSYERVVDVSCLSRNVLLTISEEKECKAADPLTLSCVTIAADSKSIKQDRMLGKILSLKKCIALASGDVAYQTADWKMHVFDNENKRTSSCPLDDGVATMSLCRPRVVYFDGHFWSIPKFVDLKQVLTDATPFSADLVRLISEYSVAGVDDGSREMALPASKSITVRGATLMTDIPILSFSDTTLPGKILLINTVDDLKKMINEALEQLNAILRLSRVDKLTGDLGILFGALLTLKARVEDRWQMLDGEPLLSVASQIGDLTTKSIWHKLYRQARSLPEIKRRKSDIKMEQKRKEEREKPKIITRADVDAAESWADHQFREITINIKANHPSVLPGKIVNWLLAVRRHLGLSAEASAKFVHLPSKIFTASLFGNPPAFENSVEMKLSRSVIELWKIIGQIEKLGSEEKDKEKDVLKQVAQLLVDFAKRDDCPLPIKDQIEELVGHIKAVDRYKPSSLEETRMLELFGKVITASKEAKVSAVHQAIVTWLEVGISQMPVPKTSKGGLFDENKEVVANLRELKGKMETAHRLITITQLGLDEGNPEPIKTISRHLSELAEFQGCPEKLRDQIGEVVRDLAKAFPAGPTP